MINSLILNAIYYLFLSEKHPNTYLSVEMSFFGIYPSNREWINIILLKKKKTKMCPTDITDSVCQKV